MPSIALRAVGGNRLTWAEVPAHIQEAIAAAAGAAVTAASSKEGGFSPALASVLALADGNHVFAKASNLARSTFAVDAIRSETRVLAALPGRVPAPRLLWSYDDGDWAILLTEAIHGYNPHQPWPADELGRFLGAFTLLAEVLTPTPVSAPGLAGDTDFSHNWRILAGDPATAARLAPGITALIERLAGLEESWVAAVSGSSLIHGDLRSDNFLLTTEGFTVVDWPAVCLGAPWVDLLFAMPSVAMHGGGDPDTLWNGHSLGRTAEPDAVNTAIAGLAGFFLYRSIQPPIPLLPTLREFQRVQGEIALDWLRGRMRWR
jgi:aminoglycoside phosphotransferase (APT) family kinase protein